MRCDELNEWTRNSLISLNYSNCVFNWKKEYAIDAHDGENDGTDFYGLDVGHEVSVPQKQKTQQQKYR